MTIPLAVLLSVAIGVAGCGCPISARAMRRGHASLPLWKSAPSLASAALDKTLRMMWHRTCTAPLGLKVLDEGMAW